MLSKTQSEAQLKLPAIAVTMGDPAGIGPELCLRMLEDRTLFSECIPLVFGDAGVLERVAARCGLAPPARVVSAAEWEKEPKALGPIVVDCRAVDARAVRPGEIQAACGRAAYRYIELGVQAALNGRVAALATAPLHKEALRLAEISHPGHTEILTALTKAKRSCMMLASDELSVSFVTAHMGFVDVAKALSVERISDVIELTADAMMVRGKTAPKIAVCALNPHAGEHGLFGEQEEQKWIEPAIRRARDKGIDAQGPLSPDAVFLPERRREFAAIVCMYHDQGHIPFKMLTFDRGVNITLGLPIVRTSVDHGTAFDIAWTGRASPTSMIQAVLWAKRLAQRRFAQTA